MRYLPRMDSCTLRVLGDLEQMRHHEIRLCCGSWSNQEGLVHLFRVLSEHIGLRVDTHGFDAESVSRVSNTTGDLASIRDQ